MLSGVVHRESLESTLRDISQRRASGNLRLCSLENQPSIGFVQGKFAWWCHSERSPIQCLTETLWTAGLIDEAEISVRLPEELLSRVHECIGDGEVFSWEIFRELHRQSLVRSLLSFSWPPQTHFEFEHAVDDEFGAFVIPYPVQQYLLDCAEQKETETGLIARYPAGLRICSHWEQDTALPDRFHQLLLTLIGDGIEISRLEALSASHPFSLRRGLAELEGKGLIAPLEHGVSNVQRDTNLDTVSEVMKFLENSVDRTFSETKTDHSEVPEEFEDLDAIPVKQAGKSIVENSAQLPETSTNQRSQSDSQKQGVNFASRVLYSNRVISIQLILFFFAVFVGAIFLWDGPLHLFFATP